jgi:hypothetical protein
MSLSNGRVGQSVDAATSSAEFALPVQTQKIFARDAKRFKIAGSDDPVLANIPHCLHHVVCHRHLSQNVIS